MIQNMAAVFIPQALIVVDDLVVSQDHQERCELNASVWVARDKHFFVEGIHALPPSPNLGYWKV